MKIESIEVEKLIPYARNARKHEAAQIASIAGSIKEFGFNNPVLIDKENVIIAGHGRVLAAQKLGLKNCPCLRLDHLSENQKKAYIIADNRLAEQGGGWDKALLKLELEEIDFSELESFTLNDFGKFDFLLEGDVNTKDAVAQMDKADELLAKWKVKPGQVWKLGNHRIMCGDCGDEKTIEKIMEKEKACCVFTDPPYGVSIGAKNEEINRISGKGGRVKRAIHDDDKHPDELKIILTKAFISFKKIAMADDCTLFVCAPQVGELGMMMMMMLKDAGLSVRHVLIWVKNSPCFSMGRLDYDYQHEPILMTWGKKHKRPMQGEMKTSIWKVDKPRSSKDHPTMKPVELYINAYLNNSDKGDVVFEPYSGSGTAIMAAENTGRTCRAIEIEPCYVAVALQRWLDATQIEPVLVDGEK